MWHPTLIFLQSHRKRGWKQPDLLSWLTLLSTSGESHTSFYLNTPETHEFLNFTHRTLISVQSITWESALTFRKDKSEAILMLKIKTHDRDPSPPLSSVSNMVSKSHSEKQPASQMPEPMVCQRNLERRHLWWQRDKIQITGECNICAMDNHCSSRFNFAKGATDFKRMERNA